MWGEAGTKHCDHIVGKRGLVDLPFCGLWLMYCLSCLFALALVVICRLCSVIVAHPGHLLCSDLD